MKALIVIAPRDFQDTEYSDTRKELEKAGIEVHVASTQGGECRGKFGLSVDAEGISNFSQSDFDAIVVIGGPGTVLLRDSSILADIIKDFAKAGKIVSAICWAPTVLAQAGVLEGKKVTVWMGHDPHYGRSTDRVLSSFGAVFEKKAVVRDGNIITADGPLSAVGFGREIANALQGM